MVLKDSDNNRFNVKLIDWGSGAFYKSDEIITGKCGSP